MGKKKNDEWDFNLELYNCESLINTKKTQIISWFKINYSSLWNIWFNIFYKSHSQSSQSQYHFLEGSGTTWSSNYFTKSYFDYN